jgi:hypothetical protein
VSKDVPSKVSSHILTYPAGAQIAEDENIHTMEMTTNTTDLDSKLFIHTCLKNDMIIGISMETVPAAI